MSNNISHMDFSENHTIPVLGLVQTIHNAYQQNGHYGSYSACLNNNQYEISNASTKEIVLSLPARQIIPQKVAAISMLAVQLLLPNEPEHAAIYGIGDQAQAHIQAMLAIYPNIIIDVIAKNPSQSLQFVQKFADRRVRCTRIVFPEVDLVITATDSKRSVYSLQAEATRLIIGVGAQDAEHIEIGRNTIQKSTIYTDDINRAKLNAGDLIKAETDWAQVQDIMAVKSNELSSTPKLFKNMGSSIWDNAIAQFLVKTYGSKH